jgi:hypothetical protein
MAVHSLTSGSSAPRAHASVTVGCSTAANPQREKRGVVAW